MQSVPAPHLLTRRRPPLKLALAVLAVLAAAGLVLALSSGGAAKHARTESPAHPYTGLIGGVPLQQARCEQWNAGSAAERGRVVGALAYSVGGSTPYGRGTTLPAGEANALFERACGNPIAQHWLLYEIYIRAAGFHSYRQGL